MNLRIHSVLEASTVNGPGRRAVLWTQGCQGMNCPGCWNPETHSTSTGFEVDISTILEWLRLFTECPYCDSIHAMTGTYNCPIHSEWVPIEGLTISGGEPLQQAQAIAELLATVRTAFPRLSIGMFCGYSEQELDSGKHIPLATFAWWPFIRARLDFAVLGRFNRLQPANLPLVTSRNQKLVLLSDRYSLSDFEPQAIEVNIDADGLHTITGFPVRGI